MSHKRIAYIENLTSDEITITPLLVTEESTKSFVLDNYSMLTFDGVQKMCEQQFYNNIKFYDEYNDVISESEFLEYTSYISNKIAPCGTNFFKIYLLLSEDVRHRYIDYTIAPKSVDYKTDLYKRLQPKFTFDKGFLIEAEYFEFLDVTQDSFGIDQFTYSNPLLKVSINYEIGEDGYVFRRTTTRQWQRAYGAYDEDTKITVKYYSKKAAREEGIRRRTNIIDQTLIEACGMIMINHSIGVFDAEIMSLPLLDYIDSRINKYLKGNLEPLITTISTVDLVTRFSTPNWLDDFVPGTGDTVTIRQYIISKLLEGNL